MISLGAICRDIMYVDDATAVLSEHATYTWNKSATRIRCNGNECGAVLEAPDGEDATILVFARHQAEQLPPPAVPEVNIPAAAALPEEPVQAPASPVTEAGPAATEPETTPVAGVITADNDALEPDQEPTGVTMDTAVAETPAAPKIRRDTKTLTATIAEINKGDRVTAFFNHPRYGQFTVEGTVVKGGAGLDRNQLMVGGWYINLNERAAKYLQELTIVATAGKHEFVIPKPSELTEHIGIGG